VARHTSTKYVTRDAPNRGHPTDAGSPTATWPSWPGEFQVPTILNTGNATQILEPTSGPPWTPNYNNVYAGLIPELLEPRHKKNDLADSPVFQTLQAVVKKIVPLNLINPEDDAAFSPSHCRTIHDIVRYAHEYSMRRCSAWRKMKSTPPARWWTWIRGCPSRSGSWTWAGVVKKGWGRKGQTRAGGLPPLPGFWKGLTAMRWAQAAPAGVKSLSSVFVKGEAEVAQGADPWRDQSYVVLAKNYMNFSIRLGYHLSTVEAYVSTR